MYIINDSILKYFIGNVNNFYIIYNTLIHVEVYTQ